MIPKLSAPLIKDIRTGEGILEYVLGVLDIVAGATGNLSISKTATFAAILAISKGTRRGLIKLVALQKVAHIGAPLEPQVLKSSIGTVAGVAGELAPTVESALAQIAALEGAAAKLQAQPGTPAEQVSAGLSPSAGPVPEAPVTT